MQAYIIVLPGHELGERIGSETIFAAQQFGINPVIHPGVNGFDSRQKFKEYGINRFLNYTIIDSPGHQGCFLSHFELWMKCAKLDEPIIILEHDGVFIRHLPDNILENFDEILRLDAFSAWKPDYDSHITASLNTEVSYHYRTHDSYYFSSGGYYVGAYGYIIRPVAAQKLINFAREFGVVCTEAHLGSAIVDIKSVSASIVRLHSHYLNRGLELSTTHDLSLALRGQNSMSDAMYIGPNEFNKIYMNCLTKQSY